MPDIACGNDRIDGDFCTSAAVYQSYRIDRESAGDTVERFLRRRAGLGRHAISRLKFQENGIRVNGKKARVTCVLREQDFLTILLSEAKAESTRTESGLTEGAEPDILYRDRDLLIVNKEPGQVVHPAHGHYEDTVLFRLKQKLQREGEPDYLGLAGRLDRETAGVLVFARNRLTAAALARQRREGVLQKTYKALVSGRMECAEGVIDLPVGKKPESLMQMEVNPQGMQAYTEYRVLEQYEKAALVEVKIRTGRTHQIRVHMAAVGHPLIGDGLYGTTLENDRYGSRLLAERVCLKQPFTGEKIEIHAKPPAGFFAAGFEKR